MKYLAFLLILSSCSTFQKASKYGLLTGASLGAGIGYSYGKNLGEDNGYKISSNKKTGALIGAVTGGLLGWGLARMFWQDNPENKELKQMIIDEDRPQNTEEFENSAFEKVMQEQVKVFKQYLEKNGTDHRVYDVPSQALPEEMDIALEQKVIIHEIPERKIRLNDGHTIVIEKTQAREYFFEEK